MTRSEIKTAKRWLRSRAERTEVSGLGGSGLCLTAHWLGGGQRMFYAIGEVAAWLDDREQRESLTKADITALADAHEDANYEDDGEAAYGRED